MVGDNKSQGRIRDHLKSTQYLMITLKVSLSLKCNCNTHDVHQREMHV